MNTLSFGQDESGVWGYRIGGADTVIPFKQGFELTPATALVSDISYGKTAWVNGELITGTNPVIKTGRESFSLAGKYVSGYDKSINVTFDEPFGDVPTITFETIRTGSTSSCTITITNTTINGFTFRAVNATNSGWTGYINWTATLG